GRRAVAPQNQRSLRLDSPPDYGLAHGTRLDLVLARSAQLGRSQDHVARASRRLVGRKQGWAVAALDRNVARMVDAVSRRSANGGRLSVTTRPRALRSRDGRALPAARPLLDSPGA